MELSNGLVFSSSSLAELAGPAYQPWVAAVEMEIGNTGCSSPDGINNWLLNTVVSGENSDRISQIHQLGEVALLSVLTIYTWGINLSQTTVGNNPAL